MIASHVCVVAHCFTQFAREVVQNRLQKALKEWRQKCHKGLVALLWNVCACVTVELRSRPSYHVRTYRVYAVLPEAGLQRWLRVLTQGHADGPNHVCGPRQPTTRCAKSCSVGAVECSIARLICVTTGAVMPLMSNARCMARPLASSRWKVCGRGLAVEVPLRCPSLDGQSQDLAKALVR